MELVLTAVAIVLLALIAYRYTMGTPESMCVGMGCSMKTLLRNAIQDADGLRANYG